jgi:hypothetical protein
VVGALFTFCCYSVDVWLSSALPSLTAPFTCGAVDVCGHACVRSNGKPAEVDIYFEDRKVFTLLDRGEQRSLRDRSVPAILALNALANSRGHKTLIVMRTRRGYTAVGVAGSSPILEVFPGDTSHGVDAETQASMWARKINSSLEEYRHEN